MIKKLCLFIFIIISLLTQSVYAREQIRIVGSSTLYPFVTIIAERFAKEYSFKTPIVETNGTGSGINLLCTSNVDTPDIVNASRKIKLQEKKKCEKHDIKNIKEKLIGFDGIILATASNFSNSLSEKNIFFALAKKIPFKGKIVDNFYSNWQEIDSNLPNKKIEVYGPSFTSGTREAFVDSVLVKHCINIAEFTKVYPNIEERKKACKLIRNDGVFIDMGENDNIVIHKLISNQEAIGLVSYNFYIENNKKLNAIKINNILPTYDTITKKIYPLTRQLYLYINEDNIKKVNGLKEFLTYIESDKVVGENGFLRLKDFITNTVH